MSAAFGLFRLQQVDSRISHIETRLAKIQEILGNDTELREALEQIKAAEADQRDSERIRQKAEQETHGQQIKIQQAESSLYGGGVHNPKELQDLQADILSLKKHLATLEERELEAMLKSEAAQTVLQTAQASMEKIQARLGNEHRQSLDEQASLMRDLKSLQSERSATTNEVVAEMLTVYEDLRMERRGVAVAEVSENSCGACGSTLSPAVQQSARRATQLVYCPSCGRVLYAK
ncbi:MAG: C4-type zinc ribbon domain-containing protein [Chloroflexi bacterium]|nr:C4-type zinc ribbon domain-containing protein [Chloroflexota bacterium]